jgi:hypothetical protein
MNEASRLIKVVLTSTLKVKLSGVLEKENFIFFPPRPKNLTPSAKVIASSNKGL